MKNKKGFTLVELLAVIVILALIMSIAVVSIGGVLNSARDDTFRQTAGEIISGVQQKLLLEGKLEAGQYFFTSGLLDKGGVDSPRGGKIQYIAAPSGGKTKLTTSGTAVSVTQIGSTPVYKNGGSAVTCSATAYSNVTVAVSASGGFTYTLCLTAGSGNPYINGERAAIEGGDASVIKTS